MTFFKDLLADLISKRLWPVAIALLVALVAVPTVLSKSDKPDGSALAAAQAAAARAARDATANQPVVLLAGEKSASGRIKNLAARDPYYVMPIVMGLTQFLQVRLAPQAQMRAGHDYVLIGRRAALNLPFDRLAEDFTPFQLL